MKLTYDQAHEILVSTRGAGRNLRRKLERNTWLERHDDHIAVRLHSTEIIKFYPNGNITLHAGGWETPTTKCRINTYAPVYLYSINGVWRTDKGEFVSGQTPWSGHAAGYRTWDAIMALARECRGWPGVTEECTLEGTWRATYEALCDELDVVRQVPKGRRADYPLDAIMTRFSRGMCVLREAARRVA